MKAADLVAVGRYPYTSWSMRLGERDREAISAAMERVHIGHLADKILPNSAMERCNSS